MVHLLAEAPSVVIASDCPVGAGACPSRASIRTANGRLSSTSGGDHHTAAERAGSAQPADARTCSKRARASLALRRVVDDGPQQLGGPPGSSHGRCTAPPGTSQLGDEPAHVLAVRVELLTLGDRVEHRKNGAASVPVPATHCHPCWFEARSPSARCCMKCRAPRCQGRCRSLTRKLATIMRTRLCIHAIESSCRMPASTIGSPCCACARGEVGVGDGARPRGQGVEAAVEVDAGGVGAVPRRRRRTRATPARSAPESTPSPDRPLEVGEQRARVHGAVLEVHRHPGGRGPVRRRGPACSRLRRRRGTRAAGQRDVLAGRRELGRHVVVVRDCARARPPRFSGSSHATVPASVSAGPASRAAPRPGGTG